jgi:hypothetical protein
MLEIVATTRTLKLKIIGTTKFARFPVESQFEVLAAKGQHLLARDSNGQRVGLKRSMVETLREPSADEPVSILTTAQLVQMGVVVAANQIGGS